MRPAGPVGQTSYALVVEPSHPTVRALPGHAQLGGDMGDRSAGGDPLDQDQACMHGQVQLDLARPALTRDSRAVSGG
jgi:hypothetical protein